MLTAIFTAANSVILDEFSFQYSEMPVLVRSMTDDEAVVNMVDANLQRETILPSERAFAYKMKLVASREDALHELTATLRSGDASGVREWLQNIVNEDEPDETTQKAAELMERLDQLVPGLEPEQLDEPEPDPNLVKMADEAMAMGADIDWNSDKEFPLSFDTESPQPSAEYREALLVLDDTT